MARQQEGRWDVGIKDNAVFLQRVSQGDEQLFADSLASEEACELAALLTKFADKLEKSRGSARPEESDDSEKSNDSEDSKNSEDSEDSENSDKSPD